MNEIKKLSDLIDSSKNICVFTGAGVSCASGIPDFRSADGLYNRNSGYKYTPEQIISHSFFEKHTDIFYDFYKTSMVYKNAEPNAAHTYFAQLEKCGKNVPIVTQNIDGLHSKAGSSNVMEIHGSVMRNYCIHCGKEFSVDYIINCDGIPRCDIDGSVIKPDVVLYEEPLNEKIVNRAVKEISRAELMIVAGTSLTVYPAASYLGFFRGKALVLINKTATSYDKTADLVIQDDIINVVNELRKFGV